MNMSSALLVLAGSLVTEDEDHSLLQEVGAGQQVYAALCREARKSGEPAPPLWRAFTYELCAGLVDKAKSLPQIAAEEARPALQEHTMHLL